MLHGNPRYIRKSTVLTSQRSPDHFWNIPRLTSLISAATTLISDIGLFRPALKDSPYYFDTSIRSSIGRKVVPEPFRTLDERRAYLGYWFFLSM